MIEYNMIYVYFPGEQREAFMNKITTVKGYRIGKAI